MSNFLVGTNLADVQLDKFSGDTTTVAFTLSVASSTFSALVRISGVVQTPTDDFSIVNSTLTFTTAPPSGTNNIVVTYTKAAQLGVPNDASVSADKLSSNAVTTSKILDANITTDKIADNAISLSKMASGTSGNIISYASGNPVAIATGTDGQVLTSAGAGAQPAFETLPTAGFTLGTVTSISSGSQVIVASDIPSGVKFIVLSWDNFSLNSTGFAEVRIGDSGGIETSGYDSNHEEAAFQSRNSTTGYAILTSSIAANDMNGQMILSLVDSSTNLWTATHQWRGDTSGGNIGWGAGIKALSGELTQIMMMGSNGFDGSGIANINYM
tara:strand:- start:677 stop:1657 length:981 start_codon:yes stop_codon:yes gene_type:complete